MVHETLAKSNMVWKLFFHGELCNHWHGRCTGCLHMGRDAIAGSSIHHKGGMAEREVGRGRRVNVLALMKALMEN